MIRGLKALPEIEALPDSVTSIIRIYKKCLFCTYDNNQGLPLVDVPLFLRT